MIFKKHYWLYAILTIVLLLLVFINPVNARIGYQIIDSGKIIHFYNNTQNFYVDTATGLNLSQHLNSDGSLQKWAEHSWCFLHPVTLQEICARNSQGRLVIPSTDGTSYVDVNSTIPFSFTRGIRTFNFFVRMNYHLDNEIENLQFNFEIINRENFSYDGNFFPRLKFENITINGRSQDNYLVVVDGDCTYFDTDTNEQVICESWIPLSPAQNKRFPKIYQGLIRLFDKTNNEELWMNWNKYNPVMQNAKLYLKDSGGINSDLIIDLNFNSLQPNERRRASWKWTDIQCDVNWGTFERKNYNSDSGNQDGNIIYQDFNYGTKIQLKFWNNGQLCVQVDPSGCPVRYGYQCQLAERYPDFNGLTFKQLFVEGTNGTPPFYSVCTQYADCPASVCPIKNILHDQNYSLRARQFFTCNDGFETIITEQYGTLGINAGRTLWNIYNDEHLPTGQASLSPLLIDVQNDLVCSVTNYSDADNDPKFSGSGGTTWYQNGTGLSTPTSSPFPSERIRAGTNYFCSQRICDDTNASELMGCNSSIPWFRANSNLGFSALPSTDVVIPETDWTNWIGVGLIFMGLVVAIVLWRKKL